MFVRAACAFAVALPGLIGQFRNFALSHFRSSKGFVNPGRVHAIYSV
ncbi:MAG: hypothetical protein JO041_04100 [Acidobacteria bacterium]|nr:hypothetical protein [Acidobacteriota bacterium]